jgi:hypothetical protein
MTVAPNTAIRWMDIPIAILLGIGWTILCCDWMAHFHTAPDGVFYADLIEYCNGVSTRNLLGPGTSNKRSAFAMMLPRYFSQSHQAFDGLALGAIWGQVGIGAILYLWGVLIGGRRMGISVLLLSCVAAPLTFISRVLSSYPAMSLCFVTGAFGTMWGMKRRTLFPTFIAGCGLGCTLLADTRGIVWALPWLSGMLLSILLRGSLFNKILRLCVLAIPIYYSHEVANQYYVFDAIGLESQVDIRPSLYHWLKIYPPPYQYDSNYTWGMAPISELPNTIQFLWEQTQLEVPPSKRDDGLALGRAIAQFYWEWAILGIGIALLTFLKKPWTLLAILCSVSPFVMTFHGGLTMLEEHIRFYIQTLPGIVILWAIVWERGATLWTVAVDKVLGWTPWVHRAPLIRRPIFWVGTFLVPVGLLSQIVLGSIDTPLSPQSSWRRDWDPQPSDFGDILSHYKDGRMNQGQGLEACGKSIRRLERANKPLRVTVYDDGLHGYFRRTLEENLQGSSE